LSAAALQPIDCKNHLYPKIIKLRKPIQKQSEKIFLEEDLLEIGSNLLHPLWQFFCMQMA